MMKKLVMVITVLFASCLLLVACNGNSSENANDKETSAEETGNNEQKADNEDNSNEESNASDQDNPEEESELDDEQNEEENEEHDNDQSDQGESDKGNLPETIEINEQIQNPVGVNFILEKITFEEDHITVDFNAQNHTGYITHLASGGRARGSNLGGITLEDDTGYVYRYVADNDSDRIRLDDGEQVTGTISFAGRIQDDAKSLTLIFNPEASDEGSASMPKFSFENIEIKR